MIQVIEYGMKCAKCLVAVFSPVQAPSGTGIAISHDHTQGVDFYNDLN